MVTMPAAFLLVVCSSFPIQRVRSPVVGVAAAVRRTAISASGDEVSLGGLFRPTGEHKRGGDSEDASSAVILQHDIDRLTLPGQSQQLHLYDTSNLSALRSAFSHGNSFVHVALDPEAVAKRQIGVVAIGTECQILSVSPSSKQNVRGEASSSLVVDVLGVRQVRVEQCTQFEPHVRARLGSVGELELASADDGSLERHLSEVDALSAECHALRAALSLPSTLVDQDAMRKDLASTGLGPNQAAWVVARALGGMRNLAADRRLRALQLCQPALLVSFVLAELLEERHRLLAMKALRTL
ncbi:hypothetical protein KFE25_005982 [Diacronema lutheri]|uniref:Lon N-terminal domain-containing protein n=1 Tax=Diacronema lutheri TaxID=2081491 RepID=A0A8J5XVR7_DIALT|nr:hypothetical protein KFE25_005982 [Diacronema lutheri]